MKDASKASLTKQTKSARTHLNMESSVPRDTNTRDKSKRTSITYTVTELFKTALAMQGREHYNEADETNEE